MFSGKTTELLRRLRELPISSTLVFKHTIDRRYRADAIVTHNGTRRSAIPIESADKIESYLYSGIKVVAVDEAHFFELDLVSVVQGLVRRGIHVMITSLDRSSWGRPFALVDQLLEIADKPVRMQSVCARCGASADHTQRLTPIIDGNLVGGPESYEARCRRCWVPPPESPPDSGS
jgi:thymidine kinase